MSVTRGFNGKAFVFRTRRKELACLFFMVSFVKCEAKTVQQGNRIDSMDVTADSFPHDGLNGSNLHT